jgi:hypothetical protein
LEGTHVSMHVPFGPHTLQGIRPGLPPSPPAPPAPAIPATPPDPPDPPAPPMPAIPPAPDDDDDDDDDDELELLDDAIPPVPPVPPVPPEPMPAVPPSPELLDELPLPVALEVVPPPASQPLAKPRAPMKTARDPETKSVRSIRKPPRTNLARAGATNVAGDAAFGSGVLNQRKETAAASGLRKPTVSSQILWRGSTRTNAWGDVRGGADEVGDGGLGRRVPTGQLFNQSCKTRTRRAPRNKRRRPYCSRVRGSSGYRWLEFAGLCR